MVLTQLDAHGDASVPDPVRQVLEMLHHFGAPESVLKAGKPHLGTDRLVRILQGCRQELKVVPLYPPLLPSCSLDSFKSLHPLVSFFIGEPAFTTRCPCSRAASRSALTPR